VVLVSSIRGIEKVGLVSIQKPAKKQVSEKFVPFFKPGKLLKEAVNKG